MTVHQVAPRCAVAASALPGWSVADVCAAAADAGLAGVEWGVGAGGSLEVPADAAAARAAGASAGLVCAGLSVHLPDVLGGDDATWARLVVLAREAGADHVRVYAPPPPVLHGSGHLAVVWKDLRERLTRRADLLRASGLQLLVEMAPATLLPSPELARSALHGLRGGDGALLDGVVGVVYDPANLVREGWLHPPLAVVVLGTLLRHVHVKNVAPRAERGRWGWVPASLDDGLVDWPATVGALADAGYAGWWVLDHLSVRHASGPPTAASSAVLAHDAAALLALTAVPASATAS